MHEPIKLITISEENHKKSIKRHKTRRPRTLYITKSDFEEYKAHSRSLRIQLDQNLSSFENPRPLIQLISGRMHSWPIAKMDEANPQQYYMPPSYRNWTVSIYSLNFSSLGLIRIIRMPSLLATFLHHDYHKYTKAIIFTKDVVCESLMLQYRAVNEL